MKDWAGEGRVLKKHIVGYRLEHVTPCKIKTDGVIKFSLLVSVNPTGHNDETD